MMVHLLHNNKPICEYSHIKCQYQTRSQATEAILHHHLNKDVRIAVGRCPNFTRTATEDER